MIVRNRYDAPFYTSMDDATALALVALVPAQWEIYAGGLFEQYQPSEAAIESAWWILQALGNSDALERLKACFPCGYMLPDIATYDS